MESAAKDEQRGAKNSFIAWFRGCRWPDGRRISVLDDWWATAWMAVAVAAGVAVIAIGGVDRIVGGAGGWPTVAIAAALGLGAWWWARRRLARVRGDGRRPRLPDGRWVHSYSDRAAAAGYFLSGLMPLVSVYAAADAVASEIEGSTPLSWTLVPSLVAMAAFVAVFVRLRAVEASAAQ